MRALDQALGFLGIRRTNALDAVTATLATSCLALSACISYPTLIFSASLAPYYPAGLGLALVGATIVGTTIAATSSYTGSVAYVQSQPAVVIGVIAGSIAATLHVAGMDDRILPNVLALIALSSLLSGLVFVLFGRFRYGDLIRYIPFPVIGGFLAAIGWVLSRASFTVTTGINATSEHISLLLGHEEILRWAPGVCLGAVLWYLQRWHVNRFNLPVILLGSVVLFWVVVLLAGKSPAAIAAAGWLIGPLPQGHLWTPTQHIAALAAADWRLFPAQIIGFGTLLVLSSVSLLLAASSVELAVREDIDLNQQLRIAGVANLLSGLAGGLPGYQAPSASILTSRLHAPVRFVGLSTALVCLAALLFGTTFLSYVPKMTVGLVLFFTGLGFLVDQLYRSFFRMTSGDYLVLVTVFLVAVFVGFMEGIGIGVVFGLIIFVIKYSRVGVTRRVASGSVLHSNVERPENLREALKISGDQILTMSLQGYIFFGTANKLMNAIKERIAAQDQPPLTHLILDFSLINGLDSSAVASFTKMVQYSELHNFRLVLTDLADETKSLLRRENIYEGAHKNIRVFPDLDRALEWSENEILAKQELLVSSLLVPIEATLESIFPKPSEAQEFRSFLQSFDFVKGDALIQEGAESDDLFFIESGQVMVVLALPDGAEMRLRTMDAGTVVGEIAFYLGLPRSASVVGAERGRAYRLSRQSLGKLRSEKPEMAARFHEYMARMLADKLLDTTRLLSVLKT
jgi:sulfate permease, SulP family